MPADPTADAARRSWVAVPHGSDFPFQNLPYGVFSRPRQQPRIGVAIGALVLDLAEVAAAGLFDGRVTGALELFAADRLNGFLARGGALWAATRGRLGELLAEGNREIRDAGLAERLLAPADEVELHLPFAVGDFVDFSSSLEHATAMGRILRPESAPLQDNWRHLPVGYHGRTSTIVVDGTPVRRPRGQFLPAAGARPQLAPTRRLDFELEVAFVTGPGNRPGEPIPTARARDHVFGLVLVNDWSARDLQGWEYRPLGPFTGKSFATSISPWVVPLAALEPHRVAAPPQDPPVLAYLRSDEDWGFDVDLVAELQTPAMAAGGQPPATVAATNLRHLYWTIPQQLAHLTVNGATVRPGDLCASGTVSGPEPAAGGSLMELTWNGERPLPLPGGQRRGFLADGDRVILRGWAGGRGGRPRIGFGQVAGRIEPAPAR